jgi:ankyrin repeat protein
MGKTTNEECYLQHNITPLHVAAKWGKTNMVSLLLEKGANIESKTRDGLTPLHCAARSGHEQVVDMMLERGAPISSKTKVRIHECDLPRIYVSESHLTVCILRM